jgi:hypothetical protein
VSDVSSAAGQRDAEKHWAKKHSENPCDWATPSLQHSIREPSRIVPIWCGLDVSPTCWGWAGALGGCWAWGWDWEFSPGFKRYVVGMTDWMFRIRTKTSKSRLWDSCRGQCSLPQEGGQAHRCEGPSFLGHQPLQVSAVTWTLGSGLVVALWVQGEETVVGWRLPCGPQAAEMKPGVKSYWRGEGRFCLGQVLLPSNTKWGLTLLFGGHSKGILKSVHKWTLYIL